MAIQFHDDSEDRQFRLAGEDAPLWPAVAFAALGVLLALTASARVFDAWENKPREVSATLEEGLPHPEPATTSVPATEASAEVKPPPPNPVAVEAPPPVETPAASPSVAAPSETVPAPATEPTSESASSVANPPASIAAPPTPICLPVVSIPFERNCAKLKAAGSDPAITRLLEWLTTHKDAILSVEGHADSSGAESYNVLLSFTRAQNVVTWLVHSGAPEARLASRAAGTRPPTRLTAKATTNRQVILQIEGVDACREDGAPAQDP